FRSGRFVAYLAAYQSRRHQSYLWLYLTALCIALAFASAVFTSAAAALDAASSSRIIFLVCCHIRPSISIISRQSAALPEKRRPSRRILPTRSASIRFRTLNPISGVNRSSPSSGKKARLLRSPCFTALVLP
ncbi:hypothetical protein, partial [Salmonella enterica]|uniref:hypothetical protein n=1 Tax=Salmonella enterica TaxID=28901 RepID=UPI001BAF1CF5